jgi:hypothetical protein
MREVRGGVWKVGRQYGKRSGVVAGVRGGCGSMQAHAGLVRACGDVDGSKGAAEGPAWFWEITPQVREVRRGGRE